MKVSKDSRDLSYHIIGSTTDLPLEYRVNIPIKDEIQPLGDVRCTAYSCVDCAEEKTGIEYSIDDLWGRVPHGIQGADPRDTIKETVKNGLLPLSYPTQDYTARVKPFSSYWTAHTGDESLFNNIRSAVYLVKYPIIIWTPWFNEWRGQTILPVGKTRLSYHCMTILGWKVIDGTTFLILDAHIGQEIYMNEEVLINCFAFGGSSTAVLSTKEIDTIRPKTNTEKIMDIMSNLVILYQELIAQLQAKKKPL